MLPLSKDSNIKKLHLLAASLAFAAAPAFDANTLLPENRAYYRFSGSLTTPPCSEDVRWLVLKTPLTASREQLEAFVHNMHAPNNRPLQKVNGRPILQ